MLNCSPVKAFPERRVLQPVAVRSSIDDAMVVTKPRIAGRGMTSDDDAARKKLASTLSLPASGPLGASAVVTTTIAPAPRIYKYIVLKGNNSKLVRSCFLVFCLPLSLLLRLFLVVVLFRKSSLLSCY